MKSNLRLQGYEEALTDKFILAKQGASVRPRSCGLTIFLRAHRAAGRYPLGFSLHPFPADSGPRSPAARYTPRSEAYRLRVLRYNLGMAEW